MLIIYGSLALGGIETFYVRLARSRYKNGLSTKILLTSRRNLSDKFLLDEMMKYADVQYVEDYFKFKSIKYLPAHFHLLFSFKASCIKGLMNDITHIHVSNSIYAIYFFKFLKIVNKDIPLTMGVYHSKEYIWGGKNLPFYEKINREIFQKALTNKASIFFNEKLPSIYRNYYSFSSSDVNVFPLGVIEDEGGENNNKSTNKKIRIISVGRLVSFKTYNFWMLDVVKKLREKIDVEYHIYGNGPDYEKISRKISELNLTKVVFLKGELPYANFRSVVSSYDIFIGSGTAIIEASSLGIPSIIGVEMVEKPLSYGFVCDIPGFSYNEDGLYEKTDVFNLIISYLEKNQDQKKLISSKHIDWSSKFTMHQCVENFNDVALKSKFINFKNFNYLIYSLSFFFDSLTKKILNKSGDKYL